MTPSPSPPPGVASRIVSTLVLVPIAFELLYRVARLRPRPALVWHTASVRAVLLGYGLVRSSALGHRVLSGVVLIVAMFSTLLAYRTALVFWNHAAKGSASGPPVI